MFSLHLRMAVLLSLLFAIVYAIVSAVGYYIGITDFYVYFGIALFMMFIQYLIAPKIVEWSMQVRYVKKEDYPQLYRMVEDMATMANMPMPKIGVSSMNIPNAFAFGRGLKDGRVCVTEGILNLLNPEELKAVVGHELSHLKNRDVLTITILSVIPMVLYRLAWHFMFYGRRRNNDRSANTILVGLAAFIFYFITNLLVLYASRIREYFADKGAVALGNKPAALASALYKLVYGSARIDKEELKEVEGFKAFFVNDPSRSLDEFRSLKELDLDKNGSLSTSELFSIRHKAVKVGFGDKVLELLSTHPNMLKRIKQLSQYNT